LHDESGFIVDKQGKLSYLQSCLLFVHWG